MSKPRTDGLRTGAVIALVVLLAIPAVPAGSPVQPEIRDAANDATVMQVRNEAADIHKVWLREEADRLTTTFQVQDLNDTSRAALEKLSWTLRFEERDRNWSVEAAFDETGDPVATVERDGQPVDAETEVTLGNRTVVVEWSDYENALPAGANLAKLYAYSASETLEGDAQCHGRTVADCAPNHGYGQAFPLTGTPPAVADHGLAIATERAVREADPGETVTWTLEVENRESATRSVVLNTTLPEAWSPELGRDAVTLEGQSRTSVDLEATVPADAADGTVVFTVLVAADERTVPMDLEVRVGSSAPAPVRVSADRSVAEARAGDQATYDLTITNDGETEATYDLTVEGARADWVQLERTNVTLAAGNSTVVQVTVDVPADVPSAAYTHMVVVQERDGDGRLAKTLSTRVQGADASSALPTPGIAGVLAAVAAAGLLLAGRRRFR